MTTSAAQEATTTGAPVAVDVETLSSIGAEETGDVPSEPGLKKDEAPSGGTEVPVAQPGSSGTEGGTAPSMATVAELKSAVAELKSALDAKASQDETKALEAAIDSLKELFRETEAKAQQEKEEPEERAQRPLSELQGRVTALRSDLANLEQTVRAGRAQEQVGASAVPPEVLQQVYEEVLTEILQEMNRLFGAAGPKMALEVLERVRRSNSGTEFFRVEDDKRIVATGLAQAIQRGLLSPSQVHLTFGEFRRQLSSLVPQYRQRGFDELVGARTSAYSVTTIRRLVDQARDHGEKLGGIAGRLDRLEVSVEKLTGPADERA